MAVMFVFFCVSVTDPKKLFQPIISVIEIEGVARKV